MPDHGNYNEIAPSMGWDAEVAYYFLARPFSGDRAVRQLGRSRIAMQPPKPEKCNGKRPSLTVGDLAAAVRRPEPATPAEAARLARREYRRATGWWAKGGAA